MMSGKFAGDVSPRQAWEALAADRSAVLIDVRTKFEWIFVGMPDLDQLGRDVVRVEWQTYPGMRLNDRFMDEVTAKGVTPAQPVYLICRSGPRSVEAAHLLARHGYTTYSVREGFEGQLDVDGHRVSGGWKSSGLPWEQS